MQTMDPAGEWLRLSERYRRLSDDALLGLSRQISGLTDIARQVLTQEIANRRLKIPPEEPSTPLRPEWRPDSVVEGAESPYAEDRELVGICTVWSFADALKLQLLLDTTSIPFFIGPEKATDVEAVTSSFASGVSVQIMRVGWPWAYRALQNYYPADVPPEEQVDDSVQFAVLCPRCRSTEVVFENLDRGSGSLDGKPPSKFKWSCDSCGHDWLDEGLLTPD